MVEPSEPGVRPCMKCGWFFVSPDPPRTGRCQDCKQAEDAYEPRTARVSQVDGAVRHFFREPSP
jgi:hypothetical protein